MAANLNFWYNGANGFLRVVQPRTVDQLVDALQLNFSDPNSIGDRFAENWPQLVYYFMGYLVLVALGLLVLLIFPIVGCCMCCCRCCCGNCGGRIAPPADSDKCKRVTFSVFILAFSAVSLLALVCGYLANGNIRIQTRQRGGALVQMSTGFTMFNVYKNDTLLQAEDGLFIPLRTTNHEISTILTGVPEIATNALATETKAERPLSTLLSFTQNMGNLRQKYDNIKQLRDSLAANGSVLQEALRNSTLRIRELLRSTGCNMSACMRINQTSNIVPGSNFSNIPPDLLDPPILGLEAAQSAGLPDLANRSVSQFNNIANRITNETGKQIEKVKNQMNQTTQQAETEFRQQITNPIRKTDKPIADFARVFKQQVPTVDWVGRIVFLSFVGLTSLLLLMVVLNVMGVLLGAVCRLPPDDRTCCSTRCGAACLLASTGLTFIFYFIFLLITMVMFLGGGLARTEVCRYVQDEPEVRSSIRAVDRGLGDILRNELKLNSTLSVVGVVRACERNESLYKALNVEAHGLNISQLLDLRRHGVDRMLDRLRNTTITIGNVTLVTPMLRQTLVNLTGVLNRVNMTPYEIELNKRIIQGDLQNYTDDLKQAGATFPNFTMEAIKLEELNRTLIASIRKDRQELRLNIDSAERIKREAPLDQVSNNLTMAQTTLNTRGSAILRGIMNGTTVSIWGVLQGATSAIADNVRNNVGRCRPVYDAIGKVVDPVCAGFLQAFNSMWFSYGGCLFLSIPTIIFAVKLAGLLRKVRFGHKIAPGPDRPLPTAKGEKPVPMKQYGRRVVPDAGINESQAKKALDT